jgi:hypothetical protein
VAPLEVVGGVLEVSLRFFRYVLQTMVRVWVPPLHCCTH